MEERLAWSYFAVLPLILIFVFNLGNEVSNWKIGKGFQAVKLQTSCWESPGDSSVVTKTLAVLLRKPKTP